MAFAAAVSPTSRGSTSRGLTSRPWQSAWLAALVTLVASASSVAADAAPEKNAGINAAGRQTVSITDGTGVVVSVTPPVNRIISLAPSLTDMVFDIGAERHLVGAIAHDDHPPGARHILSVGTVAGLNYEKIVQLRPELILAWEGGTPATWITRLRALQLPVYVSRTRNLPQISTTLRHIGRLTGTRATRLADRFDDQLSALKQQYAQRAKVRVFYQVWANPLMSLNGQHIISDAIRTCGGINVFQQAPNLVPRINPEAVLAAQPEVIVTASAQDNKQGQPDSGDSLDRWKAFSSLPATRHDHFVVLDADTVSRPSANMLKAVDQLCRGINQAR